MDIDNSWFKQRREALGISQNDIANRLTRLGIKTSRVTISHWESDKNVITLTQSPQGWKALAVALQWEIRDMYIAFMKEDFDNTKLPTDIQGIIAELQTFNPAQRVSVRMLLKIIKVFPEMTADDLHGLRLFDFDE